MATRTEVSEEEKRHTKKYRQSKNVEDLRDKPVGPKRILRPTKVKARHEGKTALHVKTIDSDLTYTKKGLKNVDPNAPGSDNTTRYGNIFINNRRIDRGTRLGTLIKNRKLDAKPSKFEKPAKKDKKKK